MTQWRVVPGQALQYREWDEEYVLYNDLSGDTHLLDAGAIHVLTALRAGAAGEAALAASLSAAFEFDSGSDVDAELAALLSSLQKLSLIEASECQPSQH